MSKKDSGVNSSTGTSPVVSLPQKQMNKQIALVILESEDGGFNLQLSIHSDELQVRFDNFKRVPNVLNGRATFVELTYDGLNVKCTKVLSKALPDESHLEYRPKMAKGHRLGSGNPLEPEKEN